jgi:UDP-glucose 4-epimerase
MKVLVTGGAGFVGSHLVDRLLKEGHNVIVLDDLSSGKIENVNKNAKFVKGDVRDFKIVDSLTKNVDVVYHLAAQVSVPLSMKDPLENFKINVLGTLNLLDASEKNGVKNFVYFSSAAIYGDPKTLPIKENNPTKPLSPYGLSKLVSEMYTKFFNIDVSIVRPFNIYGPRQDPSNPYTGVISKFISAAKRNTPLIIFGDGKQTRDFIYVDDVIDAVLLVTEKPGVYNIGTGKATSILELAKIILNLTNNKASVVHKNERDGDIRHSLADISKIKGLGFKPKYSLRDGLKRMMGWWDD